MQAVTKQTLKIFWQHSMRYKTAVFVIVLGIILVTVNDVVRPFFYRNLINALVGTDPNKVDIMIRIIWYILILGVWHQVVWRTIGFVNNFYQARVMSDLQNTSYEYMQGHSYSFFSNNFIGSIVTKMRRYSRAFESVVDQLYWNILTTGLRVVAILGILFYQAWLLGLVLLIWSLVYVGFAYFYARYKLKYDIARADQDTKTTAHVADTIANHSNIKLFTSFVPEVKTFHQITDKLYRLRKKAWDLGQVAEIFQGFSMISLEFVIFYVAIRYWERGLITVGDFVLLQIYLTFIFAHLWDLGRNIRTLYESLADANEMTLMLMEPHEIKDKAGAEKLQVQFGAIQFRNVDFHYDRESRVLKRFTLDIVPGERVALVGPSGGGKSTIVKLLLRFSDIQRGQIFIDNQDIASVTQESLRKQIALVPQEPILFHRSLLDNISYGRPNATKQDILAAAKAAHCDEFIKRLDQGYDTFVGERGVKLSGGERQRVAIARAILKNAPILVMDEATSSLDSESEFYIQDALRTLMKGKTTIVIAHRLSTIMSMDRIVVLEDGKILEQGRHEELVKAKQGTYQRLWEIQAGGFANGAANSD